MEYQSIDLNKATSLVTGIFSAVVWLHIGAKWIKNYNAGWLSQVECVFRRAFWSGALFHFVVLEFP